MKISKLPNFKNLTWDDKVQLGMEAREWGDNQWWIIGRIALTIEAVYGYDMIGKYAAAVGLKKRKVVDARLVCKHISEKLQKEFKRVSFSHFHYLIRSGITDPKEVREFLEKIDNENWIIEKTISEIQKRKGVTVKKKKLLPLCATCGKPIGDVCHGHTAKG